MADRNLRSRRISGPTSRSAVSMVGWVSSSSNTAFPRCSKTCRGSWYPSPALPQMDRSGPAQLFVFLNPGQTLVLEVRPIQFLRTFERMIQLVVLQRVQIRALGLHYLLLYRYRVKQKPIHAWPLSGSGESEFHGNDSRALEQRGQHSSPPLECLAQIVATRIKRRRARTGPCNSLSSFSSAAASRGLTYRTRCRPAMRNRRRKIVLPPRCSPRTKPCRVSAASSSSPSLRLFSSGNAASTKGFVIGRIAINGDLSAPRPARLNAWASEFSQCTAAHSCNGKIARNFPRQIHARSGASDCPVPPPPLAKAVRS